MLYNNMHVVLCEKITTGVKVAPKNGLLKIDDNRIGSMEYLVNCLLNEATFSQRAWPSRFYVGHRYVLLKFSIAVSS